MNIATASANLARQGIKHKLVIANDIPKLVFPALRDWNQRGGSAPVCMSYNMWDVAGPNGGVASFSISYVSDKQGEPVLYRLECNGLSSWIGQKPADKYDRYVFNGVTFVPFSFDSAKTYTAKKAHDVLCRWYLNVYGVWPGPPKQAGIVKKQGPGHLITEDQAREYFYNHAIKYLQELPDSTPMNWTRVIQAMYHVDRDKGQNVRQREDINMQDAARLMQYMARKLKQRKV